MAVTNNYNNWRNTSWGGIGGTSGVSGSSNVSSASNASATSAQDDDYAREYQEYLNQHQEWEKQKAEATRQWEEQLAQLKREADNAHSENVGYQSVHGGSVDYKLQQRDSIAQQAYARFYNAGANIPPEPKWNSPYTR